MALSWNEIKTRAIRFSKEWENETSENAEAKSFWDDFFNVFGISRRRVATFETKVTKENRKDGFIDLLWKGHMLIEHKSGGKDLDRAYKQAIEYFPGLQEHELPKYILVCNFHTFQLYDLDENTIHQFELSDFVKNVHHFAFIAGYQKRIYKEEDPVNTKAAELMGKLHDNLFDIGYKGHQLEVYLVRLLFCLFADDTGIFEKGIFEEYLERNTKEDGSDLAAKLSQIFEILNIPKDNRLKNLDESLASFPYVNGKLFEEHLHTAAFDSSMRKILLQCSKLNWGTISPAIFGSLFQSVMNPEERRNLGAHYTSEKNILKLIKPLFLDDLWKEFESVKNYKNKLDKFHEKIASLRFLDPACGCGNFLVITYRELRLLEIEIIKTLLFKHMKLRKEVAQEAKIDISALIKIDVDLFYGIEYEEFPVHIAQVAMWLIDHQMNIKVTEVFGEYYVRLPLRKSPVIVHANALQIDWQSLLNPLNSIDVVAKHANIYLAEEQTFNYDTVNVKTETYKIHKGQTPKPQKIINFNYILGNPPFVGKQFQNDEQKSDIDLIWSGTKGTGILDYVTCWYIKAAEYLNKYSPQNDTANIDGTKVAFVSTNSITQGEQIGILWNELFNNYKIKIHFAHRTFSWTNEARGKATVHVVIIGFANFDISEKRIFEYEDIKGEPHELKVKNINPYLIEGKDNVVLSKNKPLCKVPNIVFGSMPNDGGNLLLSKLEKEEYVKLEPKGASLIKLFTGGEEFIKNIERYCFWLKDLEPSEIRSLPILMSKITKVKEYRLNSRRETTRKLASTPTLFGEIRQPDSDYIIIPNLSSNTRKYIPIGFKDKNVIASNLALIIPNANIFHFGILTSEMHMTWVSYVCGRLGSGFRYSNKIVYNNFPWPLEPSDKQIKAIELAAQKVLDVRAEFPQSSLADLYDPLTMPPTLIKAHSNLDKVVDLAYRPQPFTNETKRIEFLFELYEKYTAEIFSKEKTKRTKK